LNKIDRDVSARIIACLPRKGKSVHKLIVALGVSACLFASSAAVPAYASTVNSSAEQQAIARLKLVGEAAERNDCKVVLAQGPKLLDRDLAALLSKQAVAAAYDVIVQCQINNNILEGAYKNALAGTELFESSDWLWRIRFALEMDLKHPELAATSAVAMTQGRGAALNAIPIRWMWQVLGQLKEPGKRDSRLALLKTLSLDSYTPDEPLAGKDDFKAVYATLVYEDGDKTAARNIFAGLEDPSPIVRASLDPRFRAFFPEKLDVRPLLERRLKTELEVASAHPELLSPLIAASRTLRQLGKPQEALAILDRATARVDDPEAFEDSANRRNWWWDAVARTHDMLGNYAQALDAFKKGGALTEGGTLNVSQLINLAELHNDYGHGDAALETLSAFADPKRHGSPFGEMEMRFARGCAQAIVGNSDAASADIAYAKAHEADHPSALEYLHLCHNDMDGAAAALVRRLDDVDRRQEALIEMSDFDPPPVPRPKASLMQRLETLVQREDVKAAIKRAGGTRRFAMQPNEL
jgi:tetratricopeptide (TPR) repeat protein